ncbi:SDR family NAD(P)-dependent oxidoreductase [Asaia platycodi]|uniref:SDR family NAD(P)-dependent oxidoreductase n=1 Tax=Asaia platycodi TaxID=610243 RepID=UPI001F569BB1|nr:SDR family NAD(P)-dependent oxidoreductase [Asaia platycodi]
MPCNFAIMNYGTIFITGAASGIGRALAVALAAPGRQLHLADCQRNGLDDTGTACQEKGAETHLTCLDVTDQEATTKWCAQRRIDRSTCFWSVRASQAGSPPRKVTEPRSKASSRSAA